jgi:hypothetical protein
MTFLQAVNGVLRRLRETEVASVSETSYSTLIGDFVNDAREYVEGRYEWLGLDAAITIITSNGTANYIVDAAGEGGNVTQLINVTSDTVLTEMDIQKIRQIQAVSPTTGAPTHYAFTTPASDLDPTVVLYPTPDAAYTLTAHVDKTGVALSASTDVLVIPSSPVVQMAYALALSERGETGGTTSAQQLALAEIYISTAIQNEALKRPEGLMWDEEGRVSNRTNMGSL